MPVISPVEGSAVAVAGVSLDHDPPDVVAVHIAEEPSHMGVVPVMV